VFLTMPLMLEPKEKGLLDMPPRDPKTKLANRLFFERVGLVSLIMAGTGFLIYWEFGHHALSTSDIVLSQAQTAAFMSIIFVHLGYVVTARSIRTSAFSINPFSNRWLRWNRGYRRGGLADRLSAVIEYRFPHRAFSGTMVDICHSRSTCRFLLAGAGEVDQKENGKEEIEESILSTKLPSK